MKNSLIKNLLAVSLVSIPTTFTHATPSRQQPPLPQSCPAKQDSEELAGTPRGEEKPILLAYCEAMGGYASFDEQARALARQKAASARAQARAAARERKLQEKREIALRKADQEALARLGYYKGTTDGRENEQFALAVRRYNEAELSLSGNETLGESSRTALKDHVADIDGLRHANGDGVMFARLKIQSEGAYYRLRSGKGDEIFAADKFEDVRARLDKLLTGSKASVISLDVSEVAPSRIEAVVSTLKMNPSGISRFRLISSPEASKIVFSKDITIESASPAVSEGGKWVSTLRLTSSTAVRTIVNIVGRTKEITERAVKRLISICSPKSKGTIPLGRALQRVRNQMKKEKAISSDDDLIMEIKTELKGIEISRNDSERSFLPL